MQGLIEGNLIPTVNATYSLGEPGRAWKELILDNNSIHFDQSHSTKDLVSLGIETTTHNDTTSYSLQLRIKGDDDDNDNQKNIELAGGRVKKNNHSQRCRTRLCAIS